MSVIFLIDYVALGLLVGFLAGLLGVGGGGIMVPIFTILFAMQGFEHEKIMHLALGTSMATIIFTSFSSMRAHYKKDNIETSMALKIAGGVLVGTFSATFLASYLKGVYLALFFGVFMSYVAFKMFSKPHYESNPTPHGKVGNIFTGTLIGAISALVSIGGGSLTVPYLVHQNFDMKRAIGTSAAVGFPIAISGTIGYAINGFGNSDLQNYIIGYIYMPAVIIVAISSIFTVPLGVKYASILPTQKLKKVFGVLAVILSIKMIISVL